MSIGYVKGKYWVVDDRYAIYSSRDSYKNLLKACRLAGFGFECTYSYVAQRYTAEVTTIERFEKSAQLYIIKHNNAYDPNPMAAVSKALREYHATTPLVRLACMEIEAELLLDAYRAHVAQEKARRKLEDKLEHALDLLRSTLDVIPITFMQGDTVIGTAPIGELRGKPIPEKCLATMPYYPEDEDL